MRFIGNLLLLLFIGACSKNNLSETQVFGHGATGLQVASAIYHDNTIQAIDYALSLPNCKGVELDVRMDAEGQLWLFHDETLELETNLEGKVESLNTQELEQGHYSTLKKESLAKLNSETLQILGKGYTFLDLKTGELGVLNEFKSALTSLNLDTSKTALIVSSWTMFELFKDDFQVFLSINSLGDLTNAMLENQPSLRGICIRNNQITMEEVNFMKSIHKQVIIYEVRSPKGIKNALQKQAKYLLTDDLKLTLALTH